MVMQGSDPNETIFVNGVAAKEKIKFCMTSHKTQGFTLPRKDAKIHSDPSLDIAINDSGSNIFKFVEKKIKIQRVMLIKKDD